MAGPERIRIEIAYAQAESQTLIAIEVPAMSSVQSVLERFDPTQFAQTDWRSAALGVFGRRVNADHVLREGDRIEIYRALPADPKEARRDRVARQRKRQTGNAS